MTEQEKWDLKIKLVNEYMRSGGTEKIPDPDLLQDLIDFRKEDTKTHTSRIKAFFNLIFNSNLVPPYVGNDEMPNYKSLLQKGLFFDQIQITTEAEFDAVYEKYKSEKEMLFRGQREASWRLYNKLQRSWITDKLEKKGWLIEDLLERFVSEGKKEFEPLISHILKDNNIDVLNDLAVLGFLQHHGCPTPLMDWTYSFGNALYFGLDHLSANEGASEINDYFSVYFIEEKNLAGMRKLMEEIFDEQGKEAALEAIAIVAKDEEQRVEMEKHFKDRSLFDINRVYGSGLISYLTTVRHLTGFDLMFFSDKDADRGFIFSLNNSQNILNQQGVFLLNASPFKPLESAGLDRYKEDSPEEKLDQYRFCECFNINKNLEGYIRERLKADGITKEFIYPTPEIDSWTIYAKIIN